MLFFWRRGLIGVTLVLSILLLGVEAQADARVDALVRDVEKSHGSLKTFTGSVLYIVQIGKRADTSDGQVYIKKPHKIYAEIRSDVAQTVVSDGKQVVVFRPKENTFSRKPLSGKSVNTGSVLMQCLLYNPFGAVNKAELKYAGFETFVGKPYDILTAPLGKMGLVRYYISPDRYITRVKVERKMAKDIVVVEERFQDYNININVSEKIFIFTKPKKAKQER
jgi:outer membrane lipoprotein-sorting protein